jgi:hypothetical protein
MADTKHFYSNVVQVLSDEVFLPRGGATGAKGSKLGWLDRTGRWLDDWRGSKSAKMSNLSLEDLPTTGKVGAAPVDIFCAVTPEKARADFIKKIIASVLKSENI